MPTILDESFGPFCTLSIAPANHGRVWATAAWQRNGRTIASYSEPCAGVEDARGWARTVLPQLDARRTELAPDKSRGLRGRNGNGE